MIFEISQVVLYLGSDGLSFSILSIILITISVCPIGVPNQGGAIEKIADLNPLQVECDKPLLNFSYRKN